MEYTVEEFIFWLSIAVFAGLVVLMADKGIDWIRGLKYDVKENRERIEELERKIEDILGARR